MNVKLNSDTDKLVQSLAALIAVTVLTALGILPAAAFLTFVAGLGLTAPLTRA